MSHSAFETQHSSHRLVAQILDACQTGGPQLYVLLGTWASRVSDKALSNAEFLCVLYALKVRQALSYDPQITATLAAGLRHQWSVSGVYLHDNSGTGGGMQRTLNISSAAAIVAAAAGVPVAKHGGGAITGLCGSRDFFNAAGVTPSSDQAVIESRVADCGIGYIDFSQTVPYACRYPTVSPLHEVGPLVHPLPLRSRVLATTSRNYYDYLSRNPDQVGADRVLLVFNERIDELDLWTPSLVTQWERGSQCRHLTVNPSAVPSLRPAGTPDSVSCRGAPTANFAVLRAALTTEDSSLEDVIKIVVANAALSLWVHHEGATFEGSVAKAFDAVKSGGAARVLTRLKGTGVPSQAWHE